jgi:integrase
MGLYKKGKSWYIDCYYPPGRAGKRVREKIGPVKDEAQIILSERLRDIRQGRNPALRQIKPKPLQEMVTEFLGRHARGRRSYRSYVTNTNVLLRHFSGKTLQEITPKGIEDFRAARIKDGFTPATFNRQRACLSKIFNCAIDWGYYGGENPVRRVKAAQESPGRHRFLSAEEAAGLIDCAPRHQRPIIIAALHTGGRRTELLRLKWEDIDLERGVLYFDQTNTKSGKQREVPIAPELEQVFRHMRKVQDIRATAKEDVFTWNGKAFSRLTTGFERARKRAGLGKDVTFHTLRHTFASWYMINGGDLYRLQKYLGHSDIKLTMRYAHLSRDYLREGVEFMRAPDKTRRHRVDTSATAPVLEHRVSH